MKMAVIAVALALEASAAVAADATDPILQPCIACHGVGGVAARPGVPHIDGQHEQYLLDSMRAFASEARKTATVEHRQLAPAAMKALAAHYATQKIMRPQPATDPAMVKRGEIIYNNRCADCHMDNGRESDKDAPIMARQDLDYVIRQMAAFRRGERRLPAMMDDAYRGLSEADLASVAHFFAAQDPLLVPAPKTGRRQRAGSAGTANPAR